MMNVQQDHPVILFDGVCNLCNSSVQYVIKHDPQHILRFASLQSPFGQKFLSDNHLSSDNINSFILFSKNKIYTRSTTSLQVTKRLKCLIKLLYVFTIVQGF